MSVETKLLNELLLKTQKECLEENTTKNFNELYTLYDKTKSQLNNINREDVLKEKERILKDVKINKTDIHYKMCMCKALKKIVENKPITVDDKNEWSGSVGSVGSMKDAFHDFPLKNSKNFSEEVFTKREFRMFELQRESLGIQNKCNNLTFETAPHQLFLKNFMHKESHYKGILLFHGVGVGKTCSAVTIAESFRDVYSRKEKRTIILSSKNIQIGWKKTIFNPGLKEEQCTGKVFLNRNIKTKRELNRLVKEYYELMAYQSFGNFVGRLIEMSKMKYPELSKEELEKRVICDYFSDRLFIIDEVHNLRDESESDKDMKNSVLMIQKVLKHSKNMRLVLLSATPMYNRATEIVPLLNLLLLNDNKEIISNKDIFKDGSLTKKGKKALQKICKGYISYLRGEDPNTFPIRLYPNELSKEDKPSMYHKNMNNKDCILNPNKSSSIDLFGNKILDKNRLKFLELYGSPLNDYHKFIYESAEKRILMKYNDTSNKDILQIQDNNVLSQISNMVYPPPSNDLSLLSNDSDLSRGLSREKSTMDSQEIDPMKCYGDKGLKNSFTRRVAGNKVSYKYKPHLKGESDQSPFLDKDNIMNYSSKIKAVLDLIEKTNGIIFIYSYWIKSGVIPLVLALEQNGYKKFSGEKILDYPEWNGGKWKKGDRNMKREPLDFEGNPKSKVQGDFNQARYMVIAGDHEKLSHKMEEELKIATSPENKDGKQIKIIIGSVVASEGIDFKRIRSLHILEPWIHLNRIEQTIGRGIRFCSHGDLDEEQKNVLIYLHSTYNHNDKETIDSLIYRYAEKKAIDIGEIEDILKREAIDRFLFREANVITSKNVSQMNLQPPLKDSNIISMKPFDKPYSKICSYLPKCNYNSELTKKEYNSLLNTNLDDTETTTINYELSENMILSVQKKISELFQEMSIYSLDSIVGLLKDFYKLDLSIIYLSLQKMIQTKYPVFNKERELGYLIYSGYYYIFQPLLLKDESIPLYYRTYPEVKITDELYLPKPNKVVSRLSDYPKTFDESVESNVRIIYEKIEKYLESFPLKEILQSFPNKINPNHQLCYSYQYDRLSFIDRFHLCFAYLMDFKKNKEIDILLEECMIYTKNGSLSVSQMIDSKSKSTYKKFGFYLIDKGFPYFFYYSGKEMKEMNDLDKKELLDTLNKYSKSLIYKQKYETKLPYGYTIKRTKTNVERTLLKFNKDNFLTKKGKYPPGPGNICEDNSQGFQKKDLIDYLKKNFYELVKIIFNDEDIDDEYDDKKILSDVLELVLRYINYTEKNNTFFTYDTIWLKFPPF